MRQLEHSEEFKVFSLERGPGRWNFIAREAEVYEEEGKDMRILGKRKL